MYRGFNRRLAGSLLAVGLLFAHAPVAHGAHGAAAVGDFATCTGADLGDACSLTAGTGWVVRKADNICGLDDARMLSNPAKVSYSRLLRATPEMKKVRDEGIGPDSSKGIQLRTAAVNRVRKACNTVIQAKGHCSVWKSVRHRDGRAVSDITNNVLRLL